MNSTLRLVNAPITLGQFKAKRETARQVEQPSNKVPNGLYRADSGSDADPTDWQMVLVTSVMSPVERIAVVTALMQADRQAGKFERLYAWGAELNEHFADRAQRVWDEDGTPVECSKK